MAREMKDSGIEWIGEIPKAWKIAPLKRFAKIQTGNTPSKAVLFVLLSVWKTTSHSPQTPKYFPGRNV